MSYLRCINHVNITISAGTEALAAARQYYVGMLGMKQLPRPANLDNGVEGIWLQVGAGPQQVHISAEEVADVRPWAMDSKRHPAFNVSDVHALRKHMVDSGANVMDAEEIVGNVRFFCRDPWGNRLEFMQPDEEVGAR
ncbi:glyoxalase/bleomycin resistance protein/dioxygenase [Jimgerdemannia flammicorona]|uniref:Glyoxalase/bleomycin resistance protein/dioxygenase n=1 Tax=Jimgerdemannia flammicorona TaxID=994334 RepID=A0A433A014_9FUNG|nr:glyoxalase/bleomycin resistance protein/dioxygenase [Jimgerdemannia flammicorona]